MGVTFLTPVAALFGALAAIPLFVFARRRRRARDVRSALGLQEPSTRSWAPLAASLVLVPVVLGVAAAQPVVTSARVLPERTDAEVFVVLDISRSMLASEAPGGPTRFERARGEALALQEELADVPVGIASLTDRLLPHLFPTTDGRVFTETVMEAVGIERPPPALSFSTMATSLDALGAAPTLRYFSPSVKKRLLVVFTDGESQPVTGTLATDFAREPRVEAIFVRIGDAGERIYESGVAEAAYEPEPGDRAALAQAAAAVRGHVYEEGEIDAVAAGVRESVGSGPTRERRHEGSRFALMPYVALAAAFPLGFVLLRRNL